MEFDAALAADYDRRVRIVVPQYDRMHEVVAASVRSLVPVPARILSFGAGTGEDCVRLPEYAFTAWEPSEQMRAIGRMRTQEHSHVLWEQPNGTYDAVLSILVAHFQPEFSLDALRAWSKGPVLIAAMVAEEDPQEREDWRHHVAGSLRRKDAIEERVNELWRSVNQTTVRRAAVAYGGKVIFRSPLVRVMVHA